MNLEIQEQNSGPQLISARQNDKINASFHRFTTCPGLYIFSPIPCQDCKITKETPHFDPWQISPDVYFDSPSNQTMTLSVKMAAIVVALFFFGMCKRRLGNWGGNGKHGACVVRACDGGHAKRPRGDSGGGARVQAVPALLQVKNLNMRFIL
jgi:hypothetical protein